MGTVKEIVEKFLREKGYDGLYNDDIECGCHLGDLIPCQSEGIEYCKAGKLVPCDGTCEDSDCRGHWIDLEADNGKT